MKAQILKMSGCKTQKEFYQKFPTEEAFLKIHGKQFKKALLGERIKKAQAGTQQEFNQQNAGMSAIATTQADVQGAISNLSTGTPKKSAGMVAADATKSIPIVGSLVKNIAGLFEAGKERKRQVRAGQLSDLQLAASQSAPRMENRKYNRPDMDANVSDINQLMPAEGTGTNILGRDGISISRGGGEIANTYTPNNIYSDGGYEPLNESERIKAYYYGGHVPQMAIGGILSSVLGSGSGGSGGGLLSGVLGGLLGGGQQTTTPTTTLEPSQYVIRNNFSPNYVRAQNGSWIGKILNGNEGGVSGLVSSAITGGKNKTGNLVTNPQTSSNIEQTAGGLRGGLSAIPGMNTKMANSAGGIGESVGSVIPLPGASEILGGVGQAIGAIAENKSGKKAMDKIQRNNNQMAGVQASKVLQGMNSGYMRTGGNIRQNSDMERSGEMNTLWGGHAEPMSYNPYLPDGGETVMFRGNSHEESNGKGQTGIGVKYGEGGDLQSYNANVEVESGEPAVQLPDETGEKNLVVFGNLPIPNQFVKQLGDPDAKGKKFKTYANLLSKQENKQNKIIEKTTNELTDLEPKTPYEKIKFDTLAITIKGANQKLKDFADKKKRAADLQQAINDTAEERGIDAEHLAKGRIKAAKGAMIPIAQDGRILGPKKIKKEEVESYIKQGYKQDPNNSHRLIKTGKEAVTIEGTPGTDATTRIIPGKKYVPNENDWWRSLTPEQKMEHNRKVHERLKTDPEYQPKTEIITPGNPAIPPKTEPGEPGDEVYYDESITPEEKKQPQFFNPIGRYLPSNQEDLDPRQLTGEYYALATNQLEPVPAQQYHPNLRTPYEISMQDILNENTAATRGAERFMGYNPAAQSNLLAQQYGANEKVLGEQFRQNQGFKDKIYGENINTLNDAQLKNLGILDTQYQRQAKALSNTKDTAREALSSISDKYLNNQLQNRTLATYENLYNYRYDPNFHAWNMNGPAQWNMAGNPTADNSGMSALTPEEQQVAIEEAQLRRARQANSKSTKTKRNGAILKAMRNL